VIELGVLGAADVRAAFRGDLYGEAETMSEEWFAGHIACNDVDIARSARWIEDGELSGIALLALRGERAWIGGFGVVPALRGRGLAARYLAETLDLARDAGARTVELEVLAQNAAAIAVYRKGGFETIGELAVWSRDPLAPAAPRAVAPRSFSVGEVASVARVPSTCWQREPRSVAAWSPAELVLAGPAAEPAAYAFVGRTGARATVLDAGARDAAAAEVLLVELDRAVPDQRLMLPNEPPEGPLHDALFASGRWTQPVRQHRMRAVL
jgi:ribosomal protein S18 acetylase RimI-like enzyme